MKKVINLLCILLAFVSLGVLVYARIDQPVLVPTVTETVTVQVTAEVEITPEPEIVEPEPEPEHFILSFVGDCTLSSSKGGTGYSDKIAGDYSYPFSNVIDYLSTDDFSLANLECTISDRNMYSTGGTFTFLTPSKHLEILKEGNIEFVNTANNHSTDFGQPGLDSTYAALDEVGIAYGKAGETAIFNTESGLCIGIYCEPFNIMGKKNDQIIASVTEGIDKLKQDGAEVIIAVFHFGSELHYSIDDSESIPARAAIDAGANIVYSSHPHVLQPVEEYNGGVIMYSLGNFTFGGSTMPKDPDTAVIQVAIQRDLDGTISYEGYNAIPCCVSSTFPDDFNNIRLAYNDYRPTPYEVGSEHYNRVIAKLTGTADMKDKDPDYSAFHPAEELPPEG